MIKGTINKKRTKRGAPILSAFEEHAVMPAAAAPIVRPVEVKFDSMSLLELASYVAKQAPAIDQLRQELIRDPALIKLFSIPVIKEMGRANPEFVKFLYQTDAINSQLDAEPELGVVFPQLIEGNAAFAEELFKDKNFRDSQDELLLARLCEASEKNAAEVVKDMRDYLKLKHNTVDKSKLPTLPSAFKLIRDGMRPLARAVYAHEALAHEILTSDHFKAYIERIGSDGLETLGSKHASVAAHIIKEWMSFNKLSSAITHRVAIALASTSLENFKKVYQFTEELKQGKHKAFSVIRFSFEEYDIAMIAERNEAIANYVWSNNELMSKLSQGSKARIAGHFPALADLLLEDRQFCQRATSAEINQLGSVRRDIALKIYNKPELVSKLESMHRVELSSKYDFFADQLFADQKMVAELSKRELNYLGDNDGKAMCSNASRILANYGVASSLTVRDAEPLSKFDKVATLLRKLADAPQPSAEVVLEEKPAKERKIAAPKR